MDDNRRKVFSDSRKILNKLQLLSRFFDHEVVYRIFVRSQVIQQLFEKNEELDIEKLNLFHIQFTESIVALLRRIKVVNEKNVSLILDEIALNKDLAAHMNESMSQERAFEFARQKQTIKINQALEHLYRHFSGYTDEYPLMRNAGQFGVRYATDFFPEISEAKMDQLTAYTTQDIYQSDYAIVEKKLMGLQCRHLFDNEFYCGIRAGDRFAEIYKITGDDVYFVFLAAGQIFVLVDFKEIEDIDTAGNESRKMRMIQELTNNNIRLEQKAAAAKTLLPDDIVLLLNDYHEKVSNFDFNNFMGDFDVQANILKAMLNTESM